MNTDTISYHPMVFVVLFFITGIWIGKCCSPSIGASSFALMFTLLVYLIFPWKRKIYLVIVVIGIWRATLAFEKPSSIVLSEKKCLCRVRGQVLTSSFPLEWYSSQNKPWIKNWFIIQVDRILQAKKWQKIQFKAKVVVHGWDSGWRRGNYIELLGWLKKFSHATNPGQWDSSIFWKARSIDFQIQVLHPDNIFLLKKQVGCPVLNFFSRLRFRYIAILRDILGPTKGNFLAVLVLGAKKLLPTEWKRIFSTTGLGHFLAISGLHISILAYFIYSLLRIFSLSYPINSIGVIVIICCYALLTELDPPVVRAVFMISLYLIAPILGRRADSKNCLATTAFVLLCYNPGNLMLVGFQLSFTACIAILYRDPFLYNSISQEEQEHISTTFGFLTRKVLAYFYQACYISFVAWLGTLPLVVYYFGIFSPLSPLMSVLLFPLISILLGGTLLLLFSPLGIGLGSILLGKILGMAIEFFHSSVALFHSLPLHCNLAPPLWPALVIFYLFLIIGICHRRIPMMILLAIGVLFSSKLRTLTLPENSATILDVGHGSAVYIVLPKKRCILYDCGSSIDKYGEHILLSFFRFYGIQSIDAIILSHYDSDHYNSIYEILEHIRVKKVIVNQAFYLRGHSVIKKVRSFGVSIVVVKDREKLSDFPELSFFYPGEYLDIHTEIDNEHSLLVSVQLSNHRLLLTGDLAPKSLQIFLKYPCKQIDILQIPHHGAFLKDTKSLLYHIKPHIAFASTTSAFLSPKTSICYQKFHIPLLATCFTGAIQFIFRPDKVRVFTSVSQTIPSQ